MKVSDYIVQFLADLGIKKVFVVQGGAVAHLIDSTAKIPGIDYVCVGHEQAGAMAVHGYAAKDQGFGCAMATTGPGIINLINGVACLYYDSFPSIFIGGQVTTARYQAKELGVRQIGFQESPHSDMLAHVTKYSVTVTDAQRIRYELEKAVYIARSGRPGPVFLDVCDDVQREDINPDSLDSYTPESESKSVEAMIHDTDLDQGVERMLKLVSEARRPILALGLGVKLAGVEAEAVQLGKDLGIPMILTWGAMDFLESDDPLNAGGFGIHSARHGNFAVQNSDLLIGIGCRFSQHQTGTPLSSFAREAKKVVVDVDPNEIKKLSKLGMTVDVPMPVNAADLFECLGHHKADYPTCDFKDWQEQIVLWKERYSIKHNITTNKDEFINPYEFMQEFSSLTSEGDIIVSEVGATLSWTFQAFKVKRNQTLLTSFNNHTMGYAIPGAIGASFANPDKTVISLNGDGGIMMNIQELGVIQKHNLPIKIIILNNHGYGVIQQTQEDYFDSRYNGVTPDTGLMDPDFALIAQGFGIKAVRINAKQDYIAGLKEVLAHDGPAICIAEIDPVARIMPALTGGRPIEDISPLLPRDEFMENMLVEPLEQSMPERKKNVA